MTYEAIVAELKSKKYRPLYFLAGDEPFYIDKITQYIEHNVLEESERSFNQTILYGKETDIETVISEAKRYPMMAPYQVVIVKEAQHLKLTDVLFAYAKSPQPTTILVFAYKGKKIDKRGKAGKYISANHAYLETKKLYDNKIPDFVEVEMRHRGFSVSPKAAVILAESIGNDLSRIFKEIEKLSIILEEGAQITAEVIEKNIGISKDYNNFELQKALAKRDVFKSNTIVKQFSMDPKNHSMIATVSVLFGFFSKLLIYATLKDKSQGNVAKELRVNPFFVRDYTEAAQIYNVRRCTKIIAFLREYDLKSKGMDSGQSSEYDLMRELIFKILHC
jgi:DNA polymerase-3 subunit delta